VTISSINWPGACGSCVPQAAQADRRWQFARCGTKLYRVRTLLLLAAFVASLHAQNTAREYLNEGVSAFKSGNYSEAADRFKAAVALDPTFHVARLYLATAYVQQYMPGNETPENLQYAAAAMGEFSTVLQDEPNNLLATQYMASLYYRMKDFPNAEVWNKKVIVLDPDNKEAYYTLGVIPWTEFIGPDREARQRAQMKPEDPGPLKDLGEREALKARYWLSLTAGIESEKKALAIDPEYANAMAYMNLLIRYRSDLDDSKEQAQADFKEADSWMKKVLETQKRKAAIPNDK
jgi:tetratricopeptide (TPR) repeat protein